MQLTKIQLHLLGILLAVMVTMVVTQVNETENEFPTRPGFEFPKLNRSTMLRAKAMLRWLIDNRTENGTRTFNAGFIRLIFHDCVGGCDGCVNLLNPSNAGLGFYKLPLDLMYRDFIFPWMSRADWYALAGVTAVEYAAELTPCEGKHCFKALPEINFLYGRRDCISEGNIFRFIPGPTLDPRFTIRNTFRLNLAEITALMGAHSLGKNHQRDTRWVDDGTKFNNQYYKDMLSANLEWQRGNGSNASDWTSSTGNTMLSSDMFMAFEVSNPEGCTESPIQGCNRTNTFNLVALFAEDNEFWMREFSVAFNVMLMNGNFGRLKQPVLDTLDSVWTGGEPFPSEKNTDTDYVFDAEAFGITTPSPSNSTDQASNATAPATNDQENTPDTGASDNTATNQESGETSSTNEETETTSSDDTTQQTDNEVVDPQPAEAEKEETETEASDTAVDNPSDGADDSTSDTAVDNTSDGADDSTSDTAVDNTSDGTDDSTSDTTVDNTSDGADDSTSDTTVDNTSDDADTTDAEENAASQTAVSDAQNEPEVLEEAGTVGVVVERSDKRTSNDLNFRRKLRKLRKKLVDQNQEDS